MPGGLEPFVQRPLMYLFWRIFSCPLLWSRPWRSVLNSGPVIPVPVKPAPVIPEHSTLQFPAPDTNLSLGAAPASALSQDPAVYEAVPKSATTQSYPEFAPFQSSPESAP